jgi:hypothetical protein
VRQERRKIKSEVHLCFETRLSLDQTHTHTFGHTHTHTFLSGVHTHDWQVSHAEKRKNVKVDVK